MVVSREYVARQVQTVIAWREEWLRDQSLPMNTVLRDDLADHFLETPRMNSMLMPSNRSSKQMMPQMEETSRLESIPGGVGTPKS